MDYRNITINEMFPMLQPLLFISLLNIRVIWLCNTFFKTELKKCIKIINFETVSCVIEKKSLKHETFFLWMKKY